MNPRIHIFRQWQAEAAAYIREHKGEDIAGAMRGIDDAAHAECLLLAGMLERGETTCEQLIREARESDVLGTFR